jgi:hypothetical protein
MSSDPAKTNVPAVAQGDARKPKVLVSYSWSSPGHQETVRLWAERLISDGVDVLLDVFDLKEGQDKFTFMERMVTDPDVTHVLVVCDEEYSKKADARKAGVGTESQIISREVYEKVDQSKFIPLVCEFSSDREPYLPAFFKSRIWVDFSSSEAVNEHWEQLVRALYGKPIHQKPEIGNPPTYITTTQNVPSNPAVAKFSTFKEALLQGKRGLNNYRRDFLAACIRYADALRVRSKPEVDSMGGKILEDCGKLKAVRDLIADWVLLEGGADPTREFSDALLGLLEDLRVLKSRPPEITSWFDSWFEAHSVFVYETFLYIVAALLEINSFNILHEVFVSHYLRPESERYGEAKFESFECFCGYSEALQEILAPPRQRLYSPAAELIKRQADREDIPFSAVMQAELLVLLMAFVIPDAGWHPQTQHYASRSGFPFFIRATQHRNFLKLATITGIADANVLRQTVKDGHERLGVKTWHDFHLAFDSFWNSMNMDKLDTLR